MPVIVHSLFAKRFNLRLCLRFAFAGELRWTVVSSDISNSDENRDNLIFCDFSPATWYQLKVSATNDAGKTTAHYNFATTKLNGGTFPDSIPTETRSNRFPFSISFLPHLFASIAFRAHSDS